VSCMLPTKSFFNPKNTKFERFVGTMLKLVDGRHSRRDMIKRRVGPPTFSPATVKRRFLGRLRACQLAAGDPWDPSPSGGRFGGGRTGNPWIPVCI
jgi:hypothetical protein